MEPPLVIVDARDQDAGTAIRAAIQRGSERQYDLAEGPLFAPVLLQLGPDDHVLILSVHHIITDARSALIIAADLAEAYRAAVEVQYPRFSAPAGSTLDVSAEDVWPPRISPGGAGTSATIRRYCGCLPTGHGPGGSPGVAAACPRGSTSA